MSTADRDVVYYASDNEIYALHLSTRKRELIASLPWAPQCLDAAYGWICVGGPDSGRCAFVCHSNAEHPNARRRAVQHQAEVDALLPLDLDPESRLLAHSYFQRQQTSSPRGSRTKPEVQIHEIGGSIVNSVTIHCLGSDQKELKDDTVCIMTYVQDKVDCTDI